MRSPKAVRAISLIALAAIGASGCVTIHTPAPPPPRRVTIVTFYDALVPYGQWIFIPGFGRVWRPSAHLIGVGFVPYATGGRWEYSNVGWVFETGWPWGAIVFHYGRWFYLDGEGWLWVPDTVWGPAWVDWRFGAGYVCWAPLPPPRLTAVVVSYRPNWYVVPTRFFPNGSHAGRFVAEHADNTMVAQAAPIPPRWQPSGAPWHLGPPPRAIASAANVDLRPLSVDRPAPLPRSSLDVPDNARITELHPATRPPPPAIRPTLPPTAQPAAEKRATPRVVAPPREGPESAEIASPEAPRVRPEARVKPIERPDGARRAPAPSARPSKKHKDN